MTAHATGSLSARSEWVERTKTEVMAGTVFPKRGFDDMDDDIPF
jgi:hypothetical protein